MILRIDDGHKNTVKLKKYSDYLIEFITHSALDPPKRIETTTHNKTINKKRISLHKK